MRIKTWCDQYTDQDIEQAKRPKGYDPDYRKWPEGLYEQHQVHMYHCQQLILAMGNTKKWVGPPLKILKDGKIDGNHRLRAVYYLRKRGLNILVPIEEND